MDSVPGRSRARLYAEGADVACEGCGCDFIPSRKNQQYCKPSCRVRAHRLRVAASPPETPLARYQRAVMTALVEGAIDRYEALDLPIAPRPRVLALLEEQVSRPGHLTIAPSAPFTDWAAFPCGKALRRSRSTVVSPTAHERTAA